MEINNGENLYLDIIKEENFDIILKYIEKICPSEYNCKYSNEYYLKNVLMILNTVVSWPSLRYCNTIKSDKKYHYKSIYKKHLLWCENNVYKYAYDEILNNSNKNQYTSDLYIVLE